CPWEAAAPLPEKGAAPGQGSLPPKKAGASKSQEKGSREREAVCPWEAPELKPTDKAEICPWEAAAPLPEKRAAPGQGSLPPKKAGASKSQEKGSREREAVCPWESLGTEQPPEQRRARSPALPK
ncbi:GP179 protein, partial [Lophotis ruficrista]|nr:GP179 protein [Lophotis ruficrista]